MNRQIVVTCSSPEETKQVGKKLGELIKPGQVIELVGDVGTGKTTLTKGIAAGLKVDEQITSPTYNLKNEYEGRLKLHHLDLYRLSDPGLMASEVNELLEDSDAILVIEWGDHIKNILPQNKISVELRITGGEERKLIIDLPEGVELMNK